MHVVGPRRSRLQLVTRDADLADPAALRVDDFDVQAVDIERLADRRNVSVGAQRKPDEYNGELYYYPSVTE